ncbi:hypothetical protein B5M44_12045 [Shinella sumterensis]|nr:hypothetical protein B5M44_12045 [Shinella sumterensis]
MGCFRPFLSYCQGAYRIFGHKKRPPGGACLPRMGAFAGWLHHPAHAPSHHKNDRREVFHGAEC